MPTLGAPTDRFGAWSGGPLTGTVVTPPPSAGPSAPPSATGSSSYNPQPQGALPYAPSGGGYGGFDGGDIGPNPEWGNGGTATKTNVDPPASSGGSNPTGMGGNGTEAGLDGGGGSGSASGGTMYFDGGGVVPDGDGDDDDTAPTGDAQQSAPTDPMAVVKAALLYGRQSMGLPQSFYGDDQSQGDPSQQTQPGMDDGGVVPDQSQQQGQGQQGTGANLPDPRQTINYLSGGGGVQPEIADALEQHIDPQGTMDPAERTIATIMAAPSPNAAFGLMQHYRTRFNAYGGATKAALDKGDLAQAAAHATSAFANVPSGMKVKFAPARGGLAMSAQKIGQGAPQQQAAPQEDDQEQGLDSGGEVDMDNPSVIQKGPPSYEDGGEVQDTPAQDDDDKYSRLPTSDNIEDRRGPLDDNDQPMSNTNANSVTSKAGKSTYDAVMRKQRGFDDGGEVPADDGMPEDDSDQGVLPQENDQGDEQQPAPQASADEQDTGAPTILQPEQVKAMIDGGYDKPLDKGWGGFMSDVLSSLGPSSAQAGTLNKTLSPNPVPGPNSNTGQGTTTGQQPDVSAAMQGQQPRAPQGTQGQQGQQPGGQQGQPQSFPRQAAPGVQMKPPGQPGQTPQPDQDPQQATLDRLTKQADAIFGHDSRDMAGVTTSSEKINAQKQAYIAKGMEAAQGNSAKLEQTNAMWGNRAGIENNKEAGRDSRAANSVGERLQAAQLGAISRMTVAEQSNLFKGVVSRMNNLGPDADPQAIMQQLSPIAQQLGMKPQDLVTWLKQQSQGQGGQPQQGQQDQQAGATPKVGDRKTINGKVYVWDGQKGVPAQ